MASSDTTRSTIHTQPSTINFPIAVPTTLIVSPLLKDEPSTITSYQRFRVSRNHPHSIEAFRGLVSGGIGGLKNPAGAGEIRTEGGP